MSVLVGKKAPDFSATAVVNGGDMVEDFTLSQFQGNKYVVLFFYPLDFTFVCPTEILEFQNHLQEFRKLDAEVVGVSIDSQFSHWAWLNTPKDKGGIQGVQFPLVADLTKTIAKNYDVLAGDYYSEIDDNDNEQLGFKGAPVAYRG
ncbi:MAG: peroxiredoxin, partial [Sphingobacteriia bacterium]